ncbi:MAG: F0F1 ATP synthase subunit gamma [Bacilli bacterium]
MANIENIVKVMNFHALLRVDKSKKKAEKYYELEKKLKKVICEIYYNKNLTLDKKIIFEKNDGDIINIYIGNDLGFCGNFNSLILNSLKKDKTSKKIIIGKKITYVDDNTLFSLEKENFEKDFVKIQELLYNYIIEKRLKTVNIIYNHYYNANEIKYVTKTIFPINLEKTDDLNLNEDFVAETSINKMLSSLLAHYICYEVKIAEANSRASENIMREKITHEAKTKIAKINQEKELTERKEKKEKNFKKQLGNYRKGEEKE